MKVFFSLFIIVLAPFAFQQANAAVEHKTFCAKAKLESAVPQSEKEDLHKPAPVVEIIHFLQRSGKVPLSQNIQKGSNLFLIFANTSKTSLHPNHFDHYSVPIGIKLIFPKHYFF